MRDNIQWTTVTVRGCKDSLLWYSKSIGSSYISANHLEELDKYWVRDNEGYLNFIWKSDTEEPLVHQTRIERCSNPILWYNSYLGQIFDVIYETDSAVWVKTLDNQNAWVYKKDCISMYT
jgi:hypothetical protein